jgi:hypothetical protein
MTEEPDSEPTDESADDGRDVRELLLRGTLLVLGVLAVVALFQFYTSANAAIGQWIGPDFRASFRAVFNLVVLLGTGIGISLVVRELST